MNSSIYANIQLCQSAKNAYDEVRHAAGNGLRSNVIDSGIRPTKLLPHFSGESSNTSCPESCLGVGVLSNFPSNNNNIFTYNHKLSQNSLRGGVAFTREDKSSKANTQNRPPEYYQKQKYCNNCRKYGHPYHQCKTPITSYGLIVYRKRPCDKPQPIIEYLMICRRDTLGFIDFMRGKYSVYDKSYILNMIVQMTVREKTRLLTQSFGDIWRELWGGGGVETPHINIHTNTQYRTEEQISRDKMSTLRSGVLLKTDFYTLETLIESTMNDPTIPKWEFAEWGFPKGRRNYQEKDYDCAIREFCEETGYVCSLTPNMNAYTFAKNSYNEVRVVESANAIDERGITGDGVPSKGMPQTHTLIPIQNIMPFEENFTGSNYKSYKHKYYLTYMPYDESLRECVVQSSEVSRAEWKTYEDCMASIRHYNVEKKRVLENAHQTIVRYL